MAAAKNQKKQTEPMPKGFRFLLTLIMITWLLLGIQVMISNMGGENDKVLSMQSDDNSMTIDRVEIKISGLQRALITVDQRVTEVEKKLNDAMKTFLDPNFSPENSKNGGMSSNEINQQDKVAVIRDEELPATLDANKKVEDVEFEAMSYESDGLTAGLNDVSDRTAVLEQQIYDFKEQLEKAKRNENSSNLLLSTMKLKEAVKSEKSFAAELEALKIFAADKDYLSDDIEKLEKYANTGAPGVERLADSFDKLMDEILNMTKKNKQNPDFFDKAMIQFSGLVKVKKIETDASGNDVDDILARAYSRLNSSDVEGAVMELEELTENYALTADKWISKAEAYVESNKAIDDVFEKVTNPAYANFQAPKE